MNLAVQQASFFLFVCLFVVVFFSKGKIEVWCFLHRHVSLTNSGAI